MPKPPPKTDNIRWRGTISIDQAIAFMRSNEGQPVWLAFVRATGKKRGSIKIIARATLGAAKPKGRGPLAEDSIRRGSLHTEKGTLPMTDSETGEYFTPLISHVIGFNLLQVVH